MGPGTKIREVEAGQPGQQSASSASLSSAQARGRQAATPRGVGLQRPPSAIRTAPARAAAIAAQGGINAAKNYQNDGDSVHRLFYDDQGGDPRSRRPNGLRLAQLSVNIIDQCVAQGVPFAREYGGLLDKRSLRGAPKSRRTFYCRGETGQQLLLAPIRL